MKPPPPTPATYGSVTPSVALAATAASTALPPWRRTLIAPRVASASTLAAAPPLPTAVAWVDPVAVPASPSRPATTLRIPIRAPHRILDFASRNQAPGNFPQGCLPCEN